MAFGDIGGPVTAFIITCKTPETGTVALHEGDAVKLIGPYTVTNTFEAGDRIFGQCLVACDRNGEAVSICVRGICSFRYVGDTPVVDGVSGVVGAEALGRIVVSDTDQAVGTVVKVNQESGTVDVLL